MKLLSVRRKKNSDVTLAINDDINIEAHRVNFKINSGTKRARRDRFAATLSMDTANLKKPAKKFM